MEVIFEFSGGSRDGQTDIGEAAHQHFWVTKDGTVGKRFWIATPHALDLLHEVGPDEAHGHARAEMYEVTDRLEDGGDVLVRCRFVKYGTG